MSTFNHGFNRNVLTLMTGTTVAQAIPITISPILTRLYSPSEFGIFALFIAVVSIFGSVINGRYDLAVMQPESDEDAAKVFCLGVGISLLLSLLLMSLVIIFHDLITNVIGDELGIWILIAPISIFLMGFFNMLNYLNTRNLHYRDVAQAKVVKSAVMSTIQICYGWLLQGSSGLISGHVVAQLSANLSLISNVKNQIFTVRSMTLSTVLEQAKHYKNFPLYSAPSALLNGVSTQLSSILISVFFGASTLGFYSLVQRVLGAPSALIGGAIGQVFYQQASGYKKDSDAIHRLYSKTLRKLVFLGICIYGPVFFLAEDLFAIVFGEEWRVAGTYARVLVPFFFLRFVFAAVSTIFSVYDRMEVELFLKITLLIGVLWVFFMYRNSEFSLFLSYYSFLCAGVYALALWSVHRLIGERVRT